MDDYLYCLIAFGGFVLGVFFMMSWTETRGRGDVLQTQSDDRIIREMKKQNRKITSLMFREPGGKQYTTGVMGFDETREKPSSGENVTPRPGPSYEVNDEGELIERN